MFDSRLTDYTITRSPFRRDVVKELAHACHRAGIRLGFYYSPVDWRQVERLQEMGVWLRKYGKSVYGTRGGPFPPGKWGASTHRGNTVYLHLMNEEDEVVILPPLPGKIVSRVCMTGGRIQVNQTGAGTEISIAPNARNSIDTLVKLTLDGVR